MTTWKRKIFLANISLLSSLVFFSILWDVTGIYGQSLIQEQNSLFRTYNDSTHFNQISPPLLPLQRTKRDKDGQNGSSNGGSQGDDDNQSMELEDDYEEQCIRLPPKSRSSSTPSISINLMNLLNEGSDYMTTSDDSVKDVILLLGNTGAGKTTVTQIVAGDLTRVHAVMTQGDELVIVDDDNRIGAPTTISKTLVPELVFKLEGGGNDLDYLLDREDDNDNLNITAFYDCPGFDDTRGPEQDIAANFFMNQIVRKVARVKLLFLVIHSSVKAGHDRLDFDLLVSHATKFLKNIPNYKKSIGLVVTKVDSFNHRGKFIKSEQIMKGIVDFLRNYNQTLYSQLESSSNRIPKNELRKKIEFVDAILETNEKGEFGHITFSRSPVKCGPLSDSRMIKRTKERVIKLYSEELQYSLVDWRDFGYTLKAQTKQTLRNYVRSLNQQVSNGFQLLLNDFKDWYNENFLKTEDMSKITGDLRVSSWAFEALTRSLSTLGTEVLQGPQKFLKTLKESLEGLGYGIPVKVEKFMRHQQAYFDWFDEVNADPVERSMKDWIAPVEKVQVDLEELKDWYEFCEDLESRVGSNDWQSNRPRVASRRTGGAENWLPILERSPSNIQVRRRIYDLSTKLERNHLKVLEKIIRFAMRPVKADCDQGDKQAVLVTGNYIRLSEVLGHEMNCGGRPVGEYKHIEIYAGHTIFIDDDVNAEGMELNLVMISPNWVVVGGNKLFNLNGSPATQYSVRQAAEGEEALAGKPGGPGGSFFGLAGNTKDIQKLKITSVGGSGGNGQDGGNGWNGTNERSPDYDDAPSYEYWNFIFYQKSKHRHEGYPGYSGGHGGDGGAGGEGGKPGQIEIIIGERRTGKTIDLRILKGDGKHGNPGKGGIGGTGGLHSDGVHCEKSQWLFGLFGKKVQCERRRYAWNKSPDGIDGESGASFAGLVKRWDPTFSIVKWKSILNYKLSLDSDLGNNETKTFNQFLDSDPTLRSYFGLEGFTMELEKLSEHNLEDKMLPSLITRVESFSKENWKNLKLEQKKVLAYLLASAYSKLVALEQDQGMGMVVDLGQFFNVIKRRLEKLKESEALKVIQEEKLEFGKDIEGRINEVKRFQSEVVIPSVKKAEQELKSQLKILELEFEKLLLNSEINLDQTRVRLELGIQEEETLKLKQIMGLVGIIIRLAEVFTGVFELAGEGIPVIWEAGVGLFSGFTGFVNDLGKFGSHPEEGGTDLQTVLESGGRLLEGAANFTQVLKETLNDDNESGESSEENFSYDDDGDNNDISSSRQNNKTLITDAIAYFGEEITTNLFNKSKGDSARISKLNYLVKEAEKRVKDIQKRKIVIEKSFIPLVQTLVGSLEWMMSDLQNKSLDKTLEGSELSVRKWQVGRVLRDTKSQLEILGKGIETKSFLNAMDRIQDSLTMQIDLIEDIVKFEEQRKFANYVATINSARLKNIQVKDSKLSLAVAKMDSSILANSFKKDYQMTLHAFKQWVFPFAKLHLTKDLQIMTNSSSSSSPEAYLGQVEKLQLKWERYKGTTLGAQDTHLIHTNFTSSLRSSSPFFVWKNSRYSREISDLLSGKPVHLKADVRLSRKGRDAVKFKLIEINCKIPEGRKSQRENQQSLNEELEHFGVVMTHSGVSYYRFQGKFYVMTTGQNETIKYNFERDRTSGNRVGTNRIYLKFKNGDYLLSPYTLWTVQLVKRGSPQVSFQRLERFAEYIDLELVGTGIYVDGEGMKGVDMEVDNYYMRDGSVREDLDL